MKLFVLPSDCSFPPSRLPAQGALNKGGIYQWRFFMQIKEGSFDLSVSWIRHQAGVWSTSIHLSLGKSSVCSVITIMLKTGGHWWRCKTKYKRGTRSVTFLNKIEHCLLSPDLNFNSDGLQGLTWNCTSIKYSFMRKKKIVFHSKQLIYNLQMATYILNWFSTTLLNTQGKLNPFYVKAAYTQSPYLIIPSCLKGSNSETKRLPNQITSERPCWRRRGSGWLLFTCYTEACR